MIDTAEAYARIARDVRAFPGVDRLVVMVSDDSMGSAVVAAAIRDPGARVEIAHDAPPGTIYVMPDPAPPVAVGPPLTLNLTLDASRFFSALDAVAAATTAAFQEFGRTLAGALGTIAAALTRHQERPRHGPGQQLEDGRWQTSLCAGWVHNECPAPDDCDCTCHGGDLR